ncbi:hypothetical protein HY11_07630 [Hyphomonas pacifica]|nr:hypothetical protein HY11_07630 [Hyphomonas pacifica]
MPTTYLTGHILFAVPAPIFEFNIIKADTETIGANLTHTAIIIKVNIAIANAPCSTIDLSTACLDRVSTQLPLLMSRLAPLIQAVAATMATAMAAILVINLDHETCISAKMGFDPGKAIPNRIGHCRGDCES